MSRLRAIVAAVILVDALGATGTACSSFEDAPAGADGGDDAPTSTTGDGASSDALVAIVDAGADADANGSPSVQYRAAILADNPLAYWRMGRIESAVVVPDETGHGHDLALAGPPDYATGAPGLFADDPAISFGGKTGYAVAASSEPFAFNGKAPFTLECWARRELDDAGATGSFFQHLFSYVDGFTTPSPSTQNGYLLYLRSDSPPATYAAHGAFDGGALQSGGKLVAVGEWAHYAMVFDGITVTLYIDTQYQSSFMVAGPIAARAAPFTLAKASNEAARYFRGSLDEVAVYDRALPLTAIATHAALGRTQ